MTCISSNGSWIFVLAPKKLKASMRLSKEVLYETKCKLFDFTSKLRHVNRKENDLILIRFPPLKKKLLKMTMTNSNKVMIKQVYSCTGHHHVNWYSYFGNHIAICISGLKLFITFDQVIILINLY